MSLSDVRSGMAETRRPPIVLLAIFSILGPMSIHLILPSLPRLQEVFAVDYARVQLLVSLYMLAFGFAQLAVGTLADLFGQRRVLLFGMAAYALAGAVGVASSSLDMLILLRVVQGIGVCAGTVVARSIVRLWYGDSEATRILGYLAMGVALGPMFAPSLGGVILEYVGWRGLFATMAVLGAACLLLVAGFVTDRAAPNRSGGGGRRLVRDIGRLVRDRDFVLCLLAVSFNAGVVLTFLAGAPFVGSRLLSLTPTMFGLWYGVGAIGYIVGNYAAGRLAEGLRRETVLLAGAALVFLCSLGLMTILALRLPVPLAVFGTFGVIMAGSGLVMPNAYAAAMNAVPATSGSASGFLGFGQYMLGAVLSIAGNIAMEAWASPMALGLIMAVSAFGGFVAALVLARGRPG